MRRPASLAVLEAALRDAAAQGWSDRTLSNASTDISECSPCSIANACGDDSDKIVCSAHRKLSARSRCRSFDGPHLTSLVKSSAGDAAHAGEISCVVAGPSFGGFFSW